LVNNYDVICTEDLCVKGLIRTRLARSVADAGWSEFIRQIEYKANWAGKNHIRIGRFEPSSQMCSGCGAKQKLLLSQRTYECACGLVMDRDLNAAINIKQIGMCHAEFTPVEIPLMEVSALVETSYVSLKQETQLA
jgi:putative transposase